MTKRVFVSGCYDLLHSGHVEFFRQASQFGDLYVGIGSDETILNYKNHKPLFPEQERLFMVKAIRYVKDAFINDGDGVMDFVGMVDKLKPDVFVVNEDGSSEEKRRFCEERGIEYIVLQRTPFEGLEARSSTAIKRDLCTIPAYSGLANTSLNQSDTPCLVSAKAPMKKNNKIYVAGHQGMVGSAILRELQRQGYTNLITRTHKELDLCRQDLVEAFFEAEKPEYVFLAAAKVGGIIANQNALADFMYENMILEMNVIHAAWKNGCKKLEFLGSSCIYPRMASQPMKESCLLTGELEKTNEAYALAKISGLKYCEFLNRQYGTDFISVMPTNLYGPNDNYHPEHSHVLPALIRRFHEAKVNGLKEVTCWGDGSPLREFLYVDDLANLCVFLMNNYSGNETINAGTGKELTIKELTELVAEVVGYDGEIKWDTTRPNGTPRKLLDVSKATALGWTYKTELEDGIRLTYEDFLNNPMRAER